MAKNVEQVADRIPKEERFAICKKCDRANITFGILRCRECGCIMRMKVKARHSVCPIGKW